MSFWNGHHWGADAPPAADVKREGRAKHVAKALLEAGLITALTFGLIVGSTFARGGGGGRAGSGSTSATGSFSLVLHDANGNGAPDFGESVTFNVSSTVAYPMVNLTCYQGGDWMTNQNVGFYAGWPWSRDFPLSSWKWTGGAADCTATLYYQTSKGNRTLATMGFGVGR